MIGNILYREATTADATPVAEVLVSSWKQSFVGVVPDAFLNGLTVARQSERLRARLSGRDNSYRMFVAELTDGRMVGFADTGKPRDVVAYGAELYSIFLLHDFQGKGIGGRLFRMVKHFVLEQGKTSMYLRALEQSPYRPFYEKMGGRVIDHIRVQLENIEVDAVLYGWENLP
jgi:GNAT superfamily N-acetyltransferase